MREITLNSLIQDFPKVNSIRSPESLIFISLWISNLDQFIYPKSTCIWVGGGPRFDSIRLLLESGSIDLASFLTFQLHILVLEFWNFKIRKHKRWSYHGNASDSRKIFRNSFGHVLHVLSPIRSFAVRTPSYQVGQIASPAALIRSFGIHGNGEVRVRTFHIVDQTPEFPIHPLLLRSNIFTYRGAQKPLIFPVIFKGGR